MNAAARLALAVLAAIPSAAGCTSRGGSSSGGATSGASTDGAPWRTMIDSEALVGWRVIDGAGSGSVAYEDGKLVLGQGQPISAVGLAEPDASAFPRDDYELELVAARLLGNDFFAALTFPVGAGELTLVLGGWGGSLCGLSCLDGEDAAHNETKSFHGFERGRDYVILVSVHRGRVRATVNGETIADVDVTKRRCSLRVEVQECRPLGLASYQTEGAIRRLRWRPLETR